MSVHKACYWCPFLKGLAWAFPIPIYVCLFSVGHQGKNISEILNIMHNTPYVICSVIFVVCLKNLITFCTVRNEKKSSKGMISTVLGCSILVSCGIVLFYFISVIYGAPLLQSVPETFYFSCLMTATTLLPCCCILGTDMSLWYKVLCKNSPENPPEESVRTTSVCSLLGAWLGAFPIPLDWDRPWQVWPISCVIGAALGYSIGLLLASLQTYITYRRVTNYKLKLR